MSNRLYLDETMKGIEYLRGCAFKALAVARTPYESELTSARIGLNRAKHAVEVAKGIDAHAAETVRMLERRLAFLEQVIGAGRHFFSTRLAIQKALEAARSDEGRTKEEVELARKVEEIAQDNLRVVQKPIQPVLDVVEAVELLSRTVADNEKTVAAEVDRLAEIISKASTARS